MADLMISLLRCLDLGCGRYNEVCMPQLSEEVSFLPYLLQLVH